jgi:predicted MFS family arabinose efflux permease
MPNSRLLILIVGNFFVATSFMSVSGLLNEIAAALHVSTAQAGMLLAAFGLTAGICAPLLATVGSNIDRRKLLTLAMACCAVANVVGAFSQTFSQLLWARVLAAVTSAVFTPQAAATVSMLVPEKERAATLAKLMVGWAVGSVLGTPLVVWVGSTFDWRVSFIAIGVASGVVAYLVWRTVPEGVKVPALNLSSWVKIFRSRALLWLTAATTLTNVGGMIMFGYIAPIMKGVLGVTGQMLALLLLVSGIGSLIGNLFSVHLLRRLSAANVAYKCNAIAAAVLILWPLCADWLWVIFALQFITAAGGAGFPAVQQSRLVAVAPMLASATIALNSSVTYLGGAVGSVLGAGAINIVGPRYMAWVAVIFTLCALTCSVMGDKASQRELAINKSTNI